MQLSGIIRRDTATTTRYAVSVVFHTATPLLRMATIVSNTVNVVFHNASVGKRHTTYYTGIDG